jgi:uncharacterized protein YkwD
MSRHLVWLSGFALFASLSGCGGGADSEIPASAAPLVTPSSVSNASQPVSATASSAADTTCGLSSFQTELLRRINAVRASGASCGSRGDFPAVAAVSWQSTLSSAAAAHSQEMARAQYFSHTDLSGHDAGYRITQAGYAWSAWAENIAAGQASVDQVMSSWIASPGHCANLMSAQVTQVAVACARADTGTYYWTMDLARPA